MVCGTGGSDILPSLSPPCTSGDAGQYRVRTALSVDI